VVGTHLQQLQQLDIDIILDQSLHSQLCRLGASLSDQVGNVTPGLLGQRELLVLERAEALDRELDLDLEV
jgi:hypothetical protein